jgi:hypothetical protein
MISCMATYLELGSVRMWFDEQGVVDGATERPG